MVDSTPPDPSSPSPPPLAGLAQLPGLQVAAAVKDSAQQIWLAGLGAFAQAHAQGGRVFEALVRDGVALQRQTQALAEEHLAEATHKMNDMASGLAEQATHQWGRLEGIFEARVAKALHHLGLPAGQDVAALVARIEALEQQVAELRRGTDAAPR